MVGGQCDCSLPCWSHLAGGFPILVWVAGIFVSMTRVYKDLLPWEQDHYRPLDNYHCCFGPENRVHMDCCRIVVASNGCLRHDGDRDRGEDDFPRRAPLLAQSEMDWFGFCDLARHHCCCYRFYCILDLSFEACFGGTDSLWSDFVGYCLYCFSRCFSDHLTEKSSVYLFPE